MYVVGDPMLDTLNRFCPIPKTDDYRTYNVLTLHRNFNADNKEALKNVLDAIKESGEKFVFPIHPRTKKNLKAMGLKIPQNLCVIDPLPYGEMLKLISNAKRVLTDSGGVQKEAFWMNVPVIILRNETEWTEICTQKGGVLVGTDKAKILDAIHNFKSKLSSPPEFGANKRIREALYKYV